MPDKVNRVRNPNFSQGKAAPTGWSFHTRGRGASFTRNDAAVSAKGEGVTISTPGSAGSAVFRQTVSCKPEEYYRVEAVVTAELVAEDEESGVVLTIRPLGEEGSPTASYSTPGLHRAGQPIAIRTYFLAPEGTRRVELSVGIEGAKGTARIEEVRLIEILEPEEVSHPVAVPPPPLAYPAPWKVNSLCICGVNVKDRPLTALLAKYFGERAVNPLEPAGFLKADLKKAALILPDESPPPSLRSLAGLEKLAGDRVVVISLPAFAELAGPPVSLCRVRQEDDPIHAKVVFANFATRGFALHDVFPYAWPGRERSGFTQNHFRRTPAFKEFLKKKGFEVLLNSMCNQDRTSERPLCLFKQIDKGGLLVLDLNPLECESSTLGEPIPGMHFLLSALGQELISLGQYTVPDETEAQFRGRLRETHVRFPEFVVHENDVPIEQISDQLVTIGREDKTFGLPLKPKPVILVQSGLAPGDAESAYGALYWFKQLIRMEPHRCPYTEALASRFRLAWVPHNALWSHRMGFRRKREPVGGMAIDLDGGSVGVLIDLVSRPINAARVVLGSKGGQSKHIERYLPPLLTAFPPGQHFGLSVGQGEDFADRTGYRWRHVKPEVSVVVDPDAFESDAHQEIKAGGGELIRIEVPGCDHDFAANSIHRTDLTATLLEHVIGLQFGLIAVNRFKTPVRFGPFAPVGPGKALIIDAGDPMLNVDVTQVG